MTRRKSQVQPALDPYGFVESRYADKYTFHIDGEVATLWFSFCGEWQMAVTMKAVMLDHMLAQIVELMSTKKPRRNGRH